MTCPERGGVTNEGKNRDKGKKGDKGFQPNVGRTALGCINRVGWALGSPIRGTAPGDAPVLKKKSQVQGREKARARKFGQENPSKTYWYGAKKNCGGTPANCGWGGKLPSECNLSGSPRKEKSRVTQGSWPNDCSHPGYAAEKKGTQEGEGKLVDAWLNGRSFKTGSTHEQGGGGGGKKKTRRGFEKKKKKTLGVGGTCQWQEGFEKCANKASGASRSRFHEATVLTVKNSRFQGKGGQGSMEPNEGHRGINRVLVWKKKRAGGQINQL